MEKVADLRVGMVLEGVVTNVAAFGAFVDVGVHQDGLVHVSAMSRKFVSDPREVVTSGQVVKVKVMEVDEARKRISLTLRLDDEPGARAGAPGPKPKRRGTAGAGRAGGRDSRVGRTDPASPRRGRHRPAARWPRRSDAPAWAAPPDHAGAPPRRSADRSGSSSTARIS